MSNNECAVCLSDSYTEICDNCRAAMRKQGIVNVNTKDDYEHWYKYYVDEDIQREVRKEICKQTM